MKNTALITGASNGIGLELAKIHASKGGDLVLVARNKSKLDEITQKEWKKIVWKRPREFIGEKFTSDELKATTDIISTMSYSKVMKTGTPIFPQLDNYQLAYHIVRESDLLAAYDFDRCMIYQIEKLNGDFDTALIDSIKLFDNRVYSRITLYFDSELL
jgi:hypothetical protein